MWSSSYIRVRDEVKNQTHLPDLNIHTDATLIKHYNAEATISQMLLWLVDRVCPENNFKTIILMIKLLCKTVAQTEAKTVISISNICFFLLTYKDDTNFIMGDKSAFFYFPCRSAYPHNNTVLANRYKWKLLLIFLMKAP